jgi:hypothetical protein
MEKNIRKFSLMMSYISFFVRIIVALVYWKDSLDFDTIIQGKNSSSILQMKNQNN